MKTFIKIYLFIFFTSYLNAQLTGKLSLEGGLYNSKINDKTDQFTGLKLYSAFQNRIISESIYNQTNLIISPFVLFNSGYKNLKNRLSNNFSLLMENSNLGLLTSANYNSYDSGDKFTFINVNALIYYVYHKPELSYEFNGGVSTSVYKSDSLTYTNKLIFNPGITYKFDKNYSFTLNLNLETFNSYNNKNTPVKYKSGYIVSTGVLLNYLSSLYLQLNYKFSIVSFNSASDKNFEHYIRLTTGSAISEDISVFFIADLTFPVQKIKPKHKQSFNPVLYNSSNENTLQFKTVKYWNDYINSFVKIGYQKENIFDEIKFSGWSLFFGTEINF